MKNVSISSSRLFWAIFSFISTISLIHAQEAVNVQAIYGGRINAIVGYSRPSMVDKHRVFVATESANSIFYADINTFSTTTVSTFTVLGCAGLDDNLGSSIQRMAAHKTSESLFFVASSTLYKTTSPYSTSATVGFTNVSDVAIRNNQAFVLNDGTTITYATLDASGSITSSGTLTSAVGSLANARLVLTPNSDKVYAFGEGTTPTIYKSSDDYNAFSGTTTFATIPVAGLSASVTWQAFGVAPDGRLFVGGSDGGNKWVAYSDNNGTTWTSVNTGLSGVSGPNFSFYRSSPSATTYHVYFAKGYNNTRGEAGSWNTFGNTSFETHPNDGSVYAFDGTSGILVPAGVFMTTDQGLGISKNGGSTITESNKGITAVQVNDFDMDDSKTTGWAATKAGIWQVTNFNTTPTWSNAMFPNGDGSPYYAAEMIVNNINQAYVGNVRVYKTTNAGSTWSQVFTAENAPYSFSSAASIKAIKVCPTNTNLVFAGYSQQGSDKGGVFYSTNGGTAWAQLRVVAAADGQDVDVNDISFNTEGGNIVAYIAVEYNSAAPSSYSIYRTAWSGSAWSTPTQSMTATETELGHDYVVSIEDLHFYSPTYVVAGGKNASNQARLYYRDLSGTNKWTYLSAYVAGGTNVNAVTMGLDTVFYAMNNIVYYKKNGGGTGTYYTYPNGTQINFLYYDALLSGTSTGMDGIYNSAPIVLAAELTKFEGRWNEKTGTELNWTTASSYNAAGFEVQKGVYTEGSSKGILFEKIGFVKDKQTAATYQFTDAQTELNQTYFYRLKQLDNNGQYTYSKVISISTGNASKTNMVILPNPSAGNVHLSLQLSQDETVLIQLFDAAGTLVYTTNVGKKTTGLHDIPLIINNLPNGVYFCRLQTSQEALTKKVIIQR